MPADYQRLSRLLSLSAENRAITNIGNANTDFDTSGNLALNNKVVFASGLAVTGTEYSVGRDADGTNQLHLNVPAAATFEFSVNDVASMLVSASGLSTTLGIASTQALASGNVGFGSAGAVTAYQIINLNTVDTGVTAGAAPRLIDGQLRVKRTTSGFTGNARGASLVVQMTNGNDQAWSETTLGGGLQGQNLLTQYESGNAATFTVSQVTGQIIRFDMGSNANITTSDYRAMWIANPVNQAGTRTRFSGLYVEGLTGASQNYQIHLVNGGTEPSAAPTDGVGMYAVDVAASTVLGWIQETAVAGAAGIASTHKVQVRINNASYFIMLSNV